MTNEAKEIISMMQELFTDLKSEISYVKNRIDKIETAQENTTNRLASIESTVARIETTQENVTNKKIQLLAEGFQSVPEMSEKLHSLSNDIEIVKFDVDIVKKVVTTHSTQLNKLGRAK